MPAAPDAGVAHAIAFRPLARADLPMLHEWLRRPHVAEWWDGEPTPDELEADYGPAIDGRDSTRAYVVLVDGAPAGFIQSYVAVDAHADGWWRDVADPGVRGIDQFLADASRLGRGIGSAMVRAFTDRLLADPAVTRVQVDPMPHNGRAIRCYEKAGFVPVGVVDTPDGPALLMHRERDA